MAKQLFSYVKSLLMSALVLSSVAFVGCEEVGQGDGPVGLPTLAIVTEEGEEVSELTINAPIEGTTYTFGVKTNATSWNATCEADWVELTKSN
ncbi:MAG: BACON domain-containing protein, partial [Rikenellaceae bacterium]|nr:BACON domain-containing protein [Rikenellaceae bacterium]